MASSPSQKWEDGRLVERAISTNVPGEPQGDEDDAQATKPYKAPVATKSAANRKAVTSAENKGVSSRRTAKK